MDKIPNSKRLTQDRYLRFGIFLEFGYCVL